MSEPQPPSPQYVGDHDHNQTDTQLMYVTMGIILGFFASIVLGTLTGSQHVFEFSMPICMVGGLILALYLKRRFKV